MLEKFNALLHEDDKNGDGHDGASDHGNGHHWIGRSGKDGM
ncbi:MAG TPA: hypothetical protein VK040_05770 [Balneolaceae bacterium]|nr:hypothetical protein [Balneolaceae bacterium]